MAFVASRKAGRVSFVMLAYPAFVPPSIVVAVIFSGFPKMGFSRAFDYLFLGTGRFMELPLIFVAYLASVLSVLVFHRIYSGSNPEVRETK
ncbi:MAG: hypothetical protein WBA51_13825 [Erythrobacter sp.]